MESLRAKKGFICDMDGVIYHGNQLLPCVKEFVEWLQKEEKQFLFLTNASSRSPKELQNKLYRMGLDIGEEHFYTSALATAKFLQSQAPGCSAYVIGDHGLYNALYDAGITINDVDPVSYTHLDVYKRQIEYYKKIKIPGHRKCKDSRGVENAYWHFYLLRHYISYDLEFLFSLLSHNDLITLLQFFHLYKEHS